MRTLLATFLMFAVALSGWAQVAPPSGAPQPQSRQPQAPAPEMEAAAKLMQAQKWGEAAMAYEAIVAAQPANAPAWYQLAMARFSMEQFREAIAAFEKNIALVKNPSAMYNAACAHARLGEKDKAIQLLQAAVAAGLPPFINMAQDSDLASLQDDPRFKELQTAVDKRRRPCMYAPEARQFDFWLGQWDVFNPQGQQAGTSEILQVAEGCGIYENWKDRAGGTGKSLNFYDAAAKKWFQYWIGASGVPGRYSGTFSDGAMRYETEPFVVNGVRNLGRLTFFHVDANTVRQLAENSTDDGKTWRVGYDFKYVRKN